MANLQLKVSSQDTSLLDAIGFIKKHRNSRKEWLDCANSNLNLNWITDRWRKLVTGKTTANTEVNQVHRKYFELCVCFELARQLETEDNIGILQLLNYTEQSLNLHHRFHHFSGHKSRIPTYR